MRKIIVGALLSACGVLLSSCATWQQVTVYPGLNVSNEVIVKPELQKLLSEKKPDLKVTLRVPAVPKDITQENQKELDRRYDYIERELAKSGFIVRDRALLEKVLSDGKPASYQELAKTIDTDLILEIVNVGPCSMSHKKYFDQNAGHLVEINKLVPDEKKPDTLPFEMQGGRLDCRVITVKDASVSGLFTIYNFPCEGVCAFEVLPGKEWRNPEPNYENVRGWNVGNDEQNIRKLATLLIQVLKDGQIVISHVQKGGIADKNGVMPEDVIMKINDQPVYNYTQALELLIKAEGTFDLMLNREGKTVRIPIAKQFAQPLGMQVVYRIKTDVPAAQAAVATPAAAPAPNPVPAAATPAAAPTPVPVEIKQEEKKPAAAPAATSPKTKKAVRKKTALTE